MTKIINNGTQCFAAVHERLDGFMVLSGWSCVVHRVIIGLSDINGPGGVACIV